MLIDPKSGPAKPARLWRDLAKGCEQQVFRPSLPATGLVVLDCSSNASKASCSSLESTSLSVETSCSLSTSRQTAMLVGPIASDQVSSQRMVGMPRSALRQKGKGRSTRSSHPVELGKSANQTIGSPDQIGRGAIERGDVPVHRCPTWSPRPRTKPLRPCTRMVSCRVPV